MSTAHWQLVQRQHFHGVALTCVDVDLLAGVGVRVPDDQVGRLVGDDGQQVPVLVPAETGAHPGQGHLESDRCVEANVIRILEAGRELKVLEA